MTAEEIRSRISHINWFHTIDLGSGVVTNGDDDSPRKLKRLKMPFDLSGQTFLDIGAWDGFFSFEAERRGASRVLALDSYVWEGMVPGKSKEGFLVARSILNSRVEDIHMDVLEISPEKIGVWDIVLLAGVLYHIKHPWLLIEKVASVTRRMLIIETATDMRFSRYPAVALYSTKHEKRQFTKICGPNIPAIRSMLQDSNFSRIEIVYKSGFFRALMSAVSHTVKNREPFLSCLQQGRCVIHACR